MTLNSILYASLLAAFSALPLGLHAADGDKAPEVKAPAADADDDKAAPRKKVKPHSHVEEKVGVTPSEAPNAAKKAAKKKNPAKDPTKHYHPRDAK